MNLTSKERNQIMESTGLSRLAPYLPTGRKGGLTDDMIMKINQAASDERRGRNGGRIGSEDSIQAAEDILKYMHDKGSYFDVKLEGNGSQLSIKPHDNKKATVRILDSSKTDCRTIGRTHVDGITYELGAAEQSMGSGLQDGNRYTPEDSLNCMKYALGDDVRYTSDIIDDRTGTISARPCVPLEKSIVGAQGNLRTRMTQKYDKNGVSTGVVPVAAAVSSVSSDKAFSVTIRDRIHSSDGTSKNCMRYNGTVMASSGVTINGYNNRRSDTKVFKASTDPVTGMERTAGQNAGEFIATKRQEAVANFETLLQKDALDEAIRRHSGNPDWSPSNPVINPDGEGYNPRPPKFTEKGGQTMAGVQARYWAANFSDPDSPSTEPFDYNTFIKDETDKLFGSADMQVDAETGKSYMEINPVNIAAFADGLGSQTNERDLQSAFKTYSREAEMNPDSPAARMEYRIKPSDEDDRFLTDLFEDGTVHFDARQADGYPKSIMPPPRIQVTGSNNRTHLENDSEYRRRMSEPVSEQDTDDVKAFKQLSDFWKDKGMLIDKSLRETGVRPDSIQVDSQGVIKYDGVSYATSTGQQQGKKDAQRKVEGEIGQVFEPDSRDMVDGKPNPLKGSVRLQYRGTEDKLLFPGYSATISKKQSPEAFPEGHPMLDVVGKDADGNDIPRCQGNFVHRTKLKGIEKMQDDAIVSTIRMNVASGTPYAETASSLNTVYRQTDGTKYPVDIVEQHKQRGMDDETIYANLQTEANMIAYPSDIFSNSQLTAATTYDKRHREGGEKPAGFDVCEDLTQGNMSIIDPDASVGYLSSNKTGTAKSTGRRRALVTHATVDAETGYIKEGRDPFTGELETKCPVEQSRTLAQMDHNNFDRIQMAESNIETQQCTLKGDAPRQFVDKDGVARDFPAEAETFDERWSRLNADQSLGLADYEKAKYEYEQEMESLKGDDSDYARAMKAKNFHGEGIAMGSFGGFTQDDAIIVFAKSKAEQAEVRRQMSVDNPDYIKSMTDKLMDDDRYVGDFDKIIRIDDADKLNEYLDSVDYIDDRVPTISSKHTPEGRPCFAGDKFLTPDGNKGVTSVVVDPDMDEETAKQLGVDKLVKFAQDNPSVRFGMSSYTASSRFNAGGAVAAIEMQENARAAGKETDLKLGDETIPGGIAYIDMVVTDMAVDVKTHDYTEEDDGGRNVSAQVYQALSVMGAKNITRELYGDNSESLATAREALILLGDDITQDGRLVDHYVPQIAGFERDADGNPDRSKKIFEQRNEFHTQVSTDIVDKPFESGNSDVVWMKGRTKKDGSVGPGYFSVHGKNSGSNFEDMMSREGGFMELPFEIELHNGTKTTQLPVLSSKLRQGRETVDGKMQSHTYTSNYKDIYTAVCEYQAAAANVELAERYLAQTNPDKYQALAQKYAGKEPLDERLTVGMSESAAYTTLTDKTSRSSKLKKMEECMQKVQGQYDTLAAEVSDRFFDRKDNIWKECLKAKQDISATKVISPNPSLDIDEVMMSRESMEKLGYNLNENGKVVGADGKEHDPRVLSVRDPVLSEGGIRYFRVKVAEDPSNGKDPRTAVIGMQMHPSAASSFEGDFDGDSMAVIPLRTPAAQAEAMALFSTQAQMLNREVEPDKDKGYDLYYTMKLDIGAGRHADEEKRKAGEDYAHVEEHFAEAQRLANEVGLGALTVVDPETGKKRIDRDNMRTANEALTHLNKAMHGASDAAFGEDFLSFESPEAHVESLMSQVHDDKLNPKAKSVEDFAIYIHNMGYDVDFTLDADGKPACSLTEDKSQIASAEDRKAAAQAINAKAELTGIAGKFFQHAAMVSVSPDEQTKKNVQAFAQKHPDWQGLSPDKLDELNRRGSYAKCATSMTHPVTQSVMQLKHSTPEEIRAKCEAVKEVLPELWAGHRVKKVPDINPETGAAVMTKDGKPDYKWVVDKDEKGQPVQMKADEFKTVLTEYYTDKKGLNVASPPEEDIELMTALLTDPQTGEVKGFSNIGGKNYENKLVNEAALQRFAFESNAQTLHQMAKQQGGTKIYTGDMNKAAQPSVLSRNESEIAKAQANPDYAPKLSVIGAKDVHHTVCEDSIDSIHAALQQENVTAADLEIETSVNEYDAFADEFLGVTSRPKTVQTPVYSSPVSNTPTVEHEQPQTPSIASQQAPATTQSKPLVMKTPVLRELPRVDDKDIGYSASICKKFAENPEIAKMPARTPDERAVKSEALGNILSANEKAFYDKVSAQKEEYTRAFREGMRSLPPDASHDERQRAGNEAVHAKAMESPEYALHVSVFRNLEDAKARNISQDLRISDMKRLNDSKPKGISLKSDSGQIYTGMTEEQFRQQQAAGPNNNYDS